MLAVLLALTLAGIVPASASAQCVGRASLLDILPLARTLDCETGMADTILNSNHTAYARDFDTAPKSRARTLDLRALYVYTGENCSGNGLLESNRQNFGALKGKIANHESVAYKGNGKYVVTFDNLALNGTSTNGTFLPYQSTIMPITTPINVQAGDSLSFDWLAELADTSDRVNLYIVSASDSEFLTSARVNGAQHVIWHAPRSGEYHLDLETPFCQTSPSTTFTRGGKITTQTTIDLNGSEIALAKSNVLSIYPNPFTGSTTVSYWSAGTLDIQLVLYDQDGKQVRMLDEGNRAEGLHSITFNSDGLAAGTYFVRFSAGSVLETGKVVLEK